jgi:hypothetical protein
MVADLQASPFSLNTPFISVFAATPGREAAQKAIRKHDIWKLLYIFAFKGVAPTTLLIKSDASLKSDIPKKILLLHSSERVRYWRSRWDTCESRMWFAPALAASFRDDALHQVGGIGLRTHDIATQVAQHGRVCRLSTERASDGARNAERGMLDFVVTGERR